MKASLILDPDQDFNGIPYNPLQSLQHSIKHANVHKKRLYRGGLNRDISGNHSIASFNSQIVFETDADKEDPLSMEESLIISNFMRGNKKSSIFGQLTPVKGHLLKKTVSIQNIGAIGAQLI